MSILAFCFENRHQVRVIEMDGKPWFVAKDVAAVLEYADPACMLKLVSKTDKKTINPHKLDYLKTIQPLNPNVFRISILNQTGLETVICFSTKAKARNWAENLNIKIHKPTKESSCLTIIANAFKHLNPISQYVIGEYRLDLYFPENNVVVECDEFGHAYYCPKKENSREVFIRQNLKATLIRFNPDARHFCIGNVINEIFVALNCNCSTPKKRLDSNKTLEKIKGFILP